LEYINAHSVKISSKS